MEDSGTVRKFEYRPCRVEAGVQVQLLTTAATLHGVCKDVSDAGIRAWFDGSVEVGSCGVLSLRHPAGVLALEAQVAYFKDGYAGLTFVFETNLERRMTKEFITSIANLAAPSHVVRFP